MSQISTMLIQETNPYAVTAKVEPDVNQYYSKGSTELATETPLTVIRLEPRRKLTRSATRTVIAMVGLPARGKSFVSRKIQLYLQWSGVDCRVFNVGMYRREAHAQYISENSSGDDKKVVADADFFDSSNEVARIIREKSAELALNDMLRWLDEEGEYSDNEDDDNIPSNNLQHPGLLSRHDRHDSTTSTATTGSGMLSYRRNERLAIFDATNSTKNRRQWILEECTSPEKRPGNPIGIIFLESICDDKELLQENYRYKISSCPDFDGLTPDEALADLVNRVKKYEDVYETITEDHLSYIKIFNLSSKLMVNHIYGRMAKELVPALMAWHIGTRPVYLCRPGQTLSGLVLDGEDYVNRNRLDTADSELLEALQNSMKRRYTLRGDGLGPNGIKFREDLYEFCAIESCQFVAKRASVRDMAHTGTSLSGLGPAPYLSRQESFEDLVNHPFHHSTNNSSFAGGFDLSSEMDGLNEALSYNEAFPLRIYTSTMPRAAETVNWTNAGFFVDQLSNLNPLDKGDYAGIEDPEEIRTMNDTWYEKYQNDTFNTRFPGGESYRDLTSRLKSVIIDIEQQVVPTLVVSHVSILQCLMAYFRNVPVDTCMSIDVPLHTVIKYTPVRGGGWSESQHPLYESN